jgi:hypothetical protein
MVKATADGGLAYCAKNCCRESHLRGSKERGR